MLILRLVLSGRARVRARDLPVVMAFRRDFCVVKMVVPEDSPEGAPAGIVCTFEFIVTDEQTAVPLPHVHLVWCSIALGRIPTYRCAGYHHKQRSYSESIYPEEVYQCLWLWIVLRH